MKVSPNSRVVQAIDRARTNDAAGAISVKDAVAIAAAATAEVERARDPAAEAKAIGAALQTLPPQFVGTQRAAHVLNVVAARVSQLQAMPAFHGADGKPADFEALTSAAKALAKEALQPRRKNAGHSIPWTGPDNVRAIAAGSPPFAEQLSREGLAYHRERGRDALTMVLTTLVQLGIAQGGRLEQGANRALLVDGIKARAAGAPVPTDADLAALLQKIDSGDLGAPPPAVAGQVKGMLEREGPPFVDDELIAPVRAALLFAYELKTPAALDSTLRSVLSMGVEQGRRLQKEGGEAKSLLLTLAVDALKRGDPSTAQTLVQRF